MNKGYLYIIVALTLLAGCSSKRTVIQQQSNVDIRSNLPLESETPIGSSKREYKQNYSNWGVEYTGEQWVKNISKPIRIEEGLENRHLSVTPSHGRYYDSGKDRWKWQRPELFCTTEDLFTQTIVIPYLIPMLENAGATVFTSRERDWQRNEVVIDNDDIRQQPQYTETNGYRTWQDAGVNGFASRKKEYINGENPFLDGTVRMARTSNRKNQSYITYKPNIPKEGRYAVYVSYATTNNSVDDAEYIVYHKGVKTVFHVNQKMGGGTWVYLGTFGFEQGCSSRNCVVVTNVSDKNGVVTSDAIRFGGGMGNIKRAGMTSGLPRCLEGARYNAQWSGAPNNVYNAKEGQDDYTDDINTRSRMTNWLAGGSCYVPNMTGLKVPLELSLAVHSDAGYHNDYSSVFGTLTICTTDYHGGVLNSGISRNYSKDFAMSLLYDSQRDLSNVFGSWTARKLYDRNYSESRLPEVPSAILETLSHQSFPDMKYGQDPNFKFVFARSIYKTILRFVADMHNTSYVVQPLAPTDFNIRFIDNNKVRLSWNPVNDPQESSAKPTSYMLYTSLSGNEFDNGQPVRGTSCQMELQPNIVYSFRVTAVNKGGESFPTEQLSAVYNEGATRTVMIVNGFHRLSSPAVHETIGEQGFDMNADPGVTYGPTAGWCGEQTTFDKSGIGMTSSSGLGFSGNELQGKFIAGNDFNYTTTHAEAIMATGKYNVASCSSKAVENGEVNLDDYYCVDLILGLEKDDGHSLVQYKSFSKKMQHLLREYTRSGGRLFVSGSYIASDMTSESERDFLSDVLKVSYNGETPSRYYTDITGMGTSFDIYRTINEDHYAATSPDVIHPIGSAFCALLYGDGRSAGVAYDGRDYKSFVIGFPFECIKSHSKRNAVMRGILSFLMKD
ncbi:MAG: fibronectin type III domain-containing protein [Prevotella sp.]|uniref:golvesin C-terminal-like domain-containing protein n=1 Tax=Prevotella sp. TaxID=59823 RepID=UPI002A2D718E|nr:fibronectin type III domain-containing protein [Prevotella sp.]MDD7318127.1 fibronectin type III domain-containing protein [Prevotellaceae bacterium]MDY4020984.1 fibronectin type III domain-containing protein [Prevotella sp.]